MYLQKAIFKNVAPFGNLELSFEKNQVIIFTGINGRGKTTVLSYIADAFFEIARAAGFEDIFEDKTKYYRVISQLTKLGGAAYSLVYFRFINEGKNVDYIEIAGKLDKEEYDKVVVLENKIEYGRIDPGLKSQNGLKVVSPTLEIPPSNITNEDVKKIFHSNILTYFPSDRLEIPGWMNEIEYKKHRFNTKTRFSNCLNKNIEARTISDQVVNWILDVVLDFTVSAKEVDGRIVHEDFSSKALYDALNLLLQKILSNKIDTCRFGIGKRYKGQSRVVIVKDTESGPETVSPSISYLSSGEISLLVLFAEIIRQYDTYNIKQIFSVSEISGIVVIDEIDKHLHIKLQKEILPILVGLFPNLQFFVSSHSPFFALGASEILQQRVILLDLPTGIDISIDNISEWDDIYRIIIEKNENYKKQVEDLNVVLKQGIKPLIITEGKTDAIHIEKAMEMLNVTDLDVEFYKSSQSMGDSELCQLLTYLSRISHNRKIIGIFDRDNLKYVNDIKDKKDFGNNVIAFCLPKPASRQSYENISIEFYYSDSDLKKEYDGRSLYFDNELEFKQSAADKNRRQLIKLENKNLDEENKKKIFDDNIGNLNWIHSKSVFADLVKNNAQFTESFDFKNFIILINKIKSFIE